MLQTIKLLPSHQTKIKYLGSVGDVQVKCYLDFLE